MLSTPPKFSIFQGIKKYRIRRVFFIALFWTIIDTLSTILNYNTAEDHSKSILTRAILVFLMSAVMGYLFVYTLRNVFKNRPIIVNFFAKKIKHKYFYWKFDRELMENYIQTLAVLNRFKK